MEPLAAVLKSGLQPASVTFVVVALAAGVLLMVFRSTARFARGYWLTLLLAYVIFATPLVADWLARRTAGDFHRIERPADARGANVIVVLGAGARTYRDGPIAVDLPMPGTV